MVLRYTGIVAYGNTVKTITLTKNVKDLTMLRVSWSYSSVALITVCSDCHSFVSAVLLIHLQISLLSFIFDSNFEKKFSKNRLSFMKLCL